MRAGSSYASRCDLRVHFGLGGAHADAIRVRWPGGDESELGPAEAGFEYRITQGGQLDKIRAFR